MPTTPREAAQPQRQAARRGPIPFAPPRLEPDEPANDLATSGPIPDLTSLLEVDEELAPDPTELLEIDDEIPPVRPGLFRTGSFDADAGHDLAPPRAERSLREPRRRGSTPWAEVPLAAALIAGLWVLWGPRAWVPAILGTFALAAIWWIRLLVGHNRSLVERLEPGVLLQTLWPTVVGFLAFLFLVLSGWWIGEKTIGQASEAAIDWLTALGPFAAYKPLAQTVLDLLFLAGLSSALLLLLRGWAEYRARVLCAHVGEDLQYGLVGDTGEPVGSIRLGLKRWRLSEQGAARSDLLIPGRLRAGKWTGAKKAGVFAGLGTGAIPLKLALGLLLWKTPKPEGGDDYEATPSKPGTFRLGEVALGEGQEVYIRPDRIVGVVRRGRGPLLVTRLDARIEQLAAGPLFLPVFRGPGRIIFAYKTGLEDSRGSVPFGGLIVVPQDCGLTVSSDTGSGWFLTSANVRTRAAPQSAIVEPASEGGGLFRRMLGLFLPWPTKDVD